MSEVKFEKLKDFGIIHKNENRVVVAALMRSTGEDGKEQVYFSFHEHFKNEKGDLMPRRLTPNPNAKFREKIISFTLPFDNGTVDEFLEVGQKIKKYMTDRAKPANKERF
jgi:hypothetical protein